MSITPGPVCFLVLEDDLDARFLTVHSLRKAFANCVVLEAASCEEAFQQIGGQHIDAVLADHHLQGNDGVMCIRDLRAAGLTCPMLMVTGNENPAIHAAAYQAGVAHVFSPRDMDFVRYLKAALGDSTAGN